MKKQDTNLKRLLQNSNAMISEAFFVDRSTPLEHFHPWECRSAGHIKSIWPRNGISEAPNKAQKGCGSVLQKPLKQICCFLILSLAFHASLSLEAFTGEPDSFIEDVFQIHIPDLPDAYNASIVEYGNGYLMAFRYDTYEVPIHLHKENYHQYIGIIYLDENFKSQGPWFECIGHRAYDPRLLKINDTVYLVFASASKEDRDSVTSSHLNVCTVKYSEDGVDIDNIVELKAPFQQKWEKNWVPFSYKNKLYFSYTISPHIVLKASLEDGICEVIANHKQDIYWPYGLIRGGTPALLIDGHYLGFFHSSKSYAVPWKYTYFIGAYIYSASPPFKLLQHTTKPFVHPDFYSSIKREEITLSNVLFPGGFILKEEKIYLCYGENDTAIKIMVIDKNFLYKILGVNHSSVTGKFL